MLALALYVLLALLGPVLGWGIVWISREAHGVGTKGRVTSNVGMCLVLPAYFMLMLRVLRSTHNPHWPHDLVHQQLPVLLVFVGLGMFGAVFNWTLRRLQPHPAYNYHVSGQNSE